MITRALWLKKRQKAWNRRSIVLLSGIRRIGKTTLAQMLSYPVYVNCDLPSAMLVFDIYRLYNRRSLIENPLRAVR